MKSPKVRFSQRQFAAELAARKFATVIGEHLVEVMPNDANGKKLTEPGFETSDSVATNSTAAPVCAVIWMV
jgi:hypothetical protein